MGMLIISRDRKTDVMTIKFDHQDPNFAKELRTELNVNWTRKQFLNLSSNFRFKILSLGEEIFLERITNLHFEPWVGLTKVKDLLDIMHKLRIIKAIAKTMLLLRAWSPIILTIRKLPDAEQPQEN